MTWMANAIDQSSISHRRVPLLRNLEKGEVLYSVSSFFKDFEKKP